MPVSKPSARRRSRKRSSHPRAEDATPKRPRSRWRKRIGWPLVAIGAVLFLAGNIGARSGIVILPFDPHHVFEQFGGALTALLGLVWATQR